MLTKHLPKLVIDVVVGTMLLTWIRNSLAFSIGIRPAYVVAVLVAIAYVAFDRLVLSGRFNFITTFLAVITLVRLFAELWFVDGIAFAFKDSIAYVVSMAVFVAFMVHGHPITYYWFRQLLSSTPSTERAAATTLVDQPMVYAALTWTNRVLLLVIAVAGLANFVLNLLLVQARFGTPESAPQILLVNQITQFVLQVPLLLVTGWAYWAVDHRIQEHQVLVQDAVNTQPSA